MIVQVRTFRATSSSQQKQKSSWTTKTTLYCGHLDTNNPKQRLGRTVRHSKTSTRRSLNFKKITEQPCQSDVPVVGKYWTIMDYMWTTYFWTSSPAPSLTPLSKPGRICRLFSKLQRWDDAVFCHRGRWVEGYQGLVVLVTWYYNCHVCRLHWEVAAMFLTKLKQVTEDDPLSLTWQSWLCWF